MADMFRMHRKWKPSGCSGQLVSAEAVAHYSSWSGGRYAELFSTEMKQQQWFTDFSPA